MITNQQLQNYYHLYKNIDVTFTREVIDVLHIKPERIVLKIIGEKIPCLLYSTSMESARIILTLKTEQLKKLRGHSQSGSLRFEFLISEKNIPLHVFVNTRIKGYSHYTSSSIPDTYFMALEFTQKPSNDFIALLGNFLEVHANSHKRKDERINVNESLIRKMGFISCSTTMATENVERKCLIRDLSFGGASFFVSGEIIEDHPGILKLIVEDNGRQLLLSGRIIRIDRLQGKQDIRLVSLLFNEDQIPLSYKVKINDFLKQLNKISH